MLLEYNIRLYHSMSYYIMLSYDTLYCNRRLREGPVQSRRPIVARSIRVDLYHTCVHVCVHMISCAYTCAHTHTMYVYSI